MCRIAAGFALACLSLFAAHAEHPRAEAKAKRAPVEDTYILVPKHSAEYTLTRSANYGDGNQPAAGVGLSFHDALSPALNTDIFIYPVGGGATVALLEEQFRAGVKYAEQQSLYTVTQWGQATDYTLRQHDGSDWQGRIVPLRMKLKDSEVDSRAYLFHHGIYAYKVRIDLPVGQAADLPAAADALVRALLPSIQVVSVGSCGKEMTINMHKKGEPDPPGYTDGISADGFSIWLGEDELETNGKDVVADLQAGKGMLGRMRVAGERQIAYGCTSTQYAPPAASDELAVLKLHYPADFWTLSPAKH